MTNPITPEAVERLIYDAETWQDQPGNISPETVLAEMVPVLRALALELAKVKAERDAALASREAVHVVTLADCIKALEDAYETAGHNEATGVGYAIHVLSALGEAH